MVDGLGSTRVGYTWNGSFQEESLEFSTQGVGYKDVKEGGKGAAFPNSTFCFEEVRGYPIDKGGNPRGASVGLDLFDEEMGETILFHDQKDEIMP